MLLRMTRFNARLMLFFLLMLVGSLAPVAALEVGKDSEDLELTVGDDLILTWDGLIPETLYRATVTDDFGQVVVEIERKSSPDGVLEPAFVWLGTGIGGCDEESDPSPDEYRFQRLEEAEAVLKGRIFQLALIRSDTETSVTRLPMLLGVERHNVFYFSDEAGCPRCRFDVGEPVYFSGTRVILDGFWLFLVENFEQPPEVGDSLVDVLGGPLEIWPLGSAFTELVTEGLPPGDGFVGIVRDQAGEPENEPDPFWTDLDAIVNPSFCGPDEAQVDIDPMKMLRTRPPDKRPVGGEEGAGGEGDGQEEY